MMNVFQTHAQIVNGYTSYIQSFLNIADPAIRKVVKAELNQGKLWPEPLLQFNPSILLSKIESACFSLVEGLACIYV